jgi:DegV family protein with EDD domain
MGEGARPVQVVTDSTADLPPHLAASLGIAVVPLIVRFGERSFRDGIELDPSRFLTELRAASDLPKTSQPPETAFEDVFQDALTRGHDVVCLTISSVLSGTLNAARLAAEGVEPGRVTVIDSGTVTLHLGWGAVAAGRAAQAGAGVEGVVAAARGAFERAQIYALLETLDYVYRGGRIGKGSQLVGSVLNIKPILTVRAGVVIPVERVRTWRKAIDRLAELARGHAPLEGLGILHVGNPGDAALLADRLHDLTPDRDALIGEAGPVIATYAGPGAVGVIPLSAARPGGAP